MTKLKPVVALIGILLGLTAMAQPKLEFREERHDFGTIKEDEGKVTYVFALENTGDEPLLIEKVKTPCGCTTPYWTKDVIPPGKGGYVEAEFDPLHRPGVFNKVLTVQTNAETKLHYLTIIGEVLPRKRTMADNFPAKRGNLRFKLPQLYLGKVNTKEVDTTHFTIFNEGGKTVDILGAETPSHIKVEVLDKTIKPGGFGKFVLSYDALKRADLGFLTDEIVLKTTDEVEPNKDMMVMAEVEIYFGPLTPKQLEQAPKLVIEPTELDLGVLKVGQIVTGKFKIRNEGKTQMKIVKIMPECGCTSTKAPAERLNPGESTILEVEFDSKDQDGHVTKIIDFYCTDPVNSHVELKIKAVVNPVED